MCNLILSLLIILKLARKSCDTLESFKIHIQKKKIQHEILFLYV